MSNHRAGTVISGYGLVVQPSDHQSPFFQTPQSHSCCGYLQPEALIPEGFCCAKNAPWLQRVVWGELMLQCRRSRKGFGWMKRTLVYSTHAVCSSDCDADADLRQCLAPQH